MLVEARVAASLLREGRPGSGQQQQHQQQRSASPSTFSLATVCNVLHGSVVVGVCADDLVVVQCVSPSHPPIIKSIDWFQRARERVVAMCVSTCSSWMACVCMSSRLVVLPLHLLTHSHLSPPPHTTVPTSLSALSKAFATEPSPKSKASIARLDDATVIGCAHSKADAPSCCVWWSPPSGKAIVVRGTHGGRVVFCDVKTASDVRSIDLSQPILALFLVSPQSLSQESLVVRTMRGEFWCVPLLAQLPDGRLHSVVRKDNHPCPEFEPSPLTQLQSGTSLTVHSQDGGSTLVATLNEQSGEVAVFDADFNPLYRMRTVPRTRHIAVLRDVVLAVACDDEVTKVCVLSKVIGAAQSDNDSASVLQVLPLARENDRVVAAFATAPSLSPLCGHGSLVGFVVTDSALLECHAATPPGVALHQLLLKGEHDEAQRLATGLSLDLCGAYESVGDAKRAQGDVEASLALYARANMPPGKLAKRMAASGKVGRAVRVLLDTLQRPEALSKTQRHDVAMAAVHCLLQQLGSGQHSAEDTERRLCEVADANWDLDLTDVFVVLIDTRHVRLLVEFAHAARQTALAFDLLAERGLNRARVPKDAVAALVRTRHAGRFLTALKEVDKHVVGGLHAVVAPDDLVALVASCPRALKHAPVRTALDHGVEALNRRSLDALARALRAHLDASEGEGGKGEKAGAPDAAEIACELRHLWIRAVLQRLLLAPSAKLQDELDAALRRGYGREYDAERVLSWSLALGNFGAVAAICYTAGELDDALEFALLALEGAPEWQAADAPEGSRERVALGVFAQRLDAGAPEGRGAWTDAFAHMLLGFWGAHRLAPEELHAFLQQHEGESGRALRNAVVGTTHGNRAFVQAPWMDGTAVQRSVHALPPPLLLAVGRGVVGSAPQPGEDGVSQALWESTLHNVVGKLGEARSRRVPLDQLKAAGKDAKGRLVLRPPAN